MIEIKKTDFGRSYELTVSAGQDGKGGPGVEIKVPLTDSDMKKLRNDIVEELEK